MNRYILALVAIVQLSNQCSNHAIIDRGTNRLYLAESVNDLSSLANTILLLQISMTASDSILVGINSETRYKVPSPPKVLSKNEVIHLTMSIENMSDTVITMLSHPSRFGLFVRDSSGVLIADMFSHDTDYRAHDWLPYIIKLKPREKITVRLRPFKMNLILPGASVGPYAVEGVYLNTILRINETKIISGYASSPKLVLDIH
jgi:hypothetical protein